ncbi:hypothetical protein, partial [Mycetohabitans sp. B3]|uniref:hypothetical protein n=1 Tax=Mycetohabitans sp. B3 TaxID=2841841 RepID=UPI001F20109A
MWLANGQCNNFRILALHYPPKTWRSQSIAVPSLPFSASLLRGLTSYCDVFYRLPSLQMDFDLNAALN